MSDLVHGFVPFAANDRGRFLGVLFNPSLPAFRADAFPQLVVGEVPEKATRGVIKWGEADRSFAKDIDEHSWSYPRPDDVSLAVESVKDTGEQAKVSVRRTSFYSGGVFDSGQSSSTF